MNRLVGPDPQLSQDVLEYPRVGLAYPQVPGADDDLEVPRQARPLQDEPRLVAHGVGDEGEGVAAGQLLKHLLDTGEEILLVVPLEQVVEHL